MSPVASCPPARPHTLVARSRRTAPLTPAPPHSPSRALCHTPVSDDGSAGLYFSGALNLTSHTTLRVEWPARLLATSNVSLYHWPLVGYKDPVTREWNCGHMPHEGGCRCGSTTCGFNMHPFLSSVGGSDDIAVDGGGTIDGNGDFFYPLRSKPHWPVEWRDGPLAQRQKTIDPRLWEPFNSSGVTLFNVTLTKPGGLSNLPYPPTQLMQTLLSDLDQARRSVKPPWPFSPALVRPGLPLSMRSTAGGCLRVGIGTLIVSDSNVCVVFRLDNSPLWLSARLHRKCDRAQPADDRPL